MSWSETSVAPRAGSVRCLSPSGVHRMAYTEWGDPANPRVLLCVHGLTRCGRDFDTLARQFAAHYRVVCPDVVGRGRSDWLDNPHQYALAQYMSDLFTLIVRLDAQTVDWFGTSMGGLIGIVLAGLPNAPLGKLLLNDVGPRLEPGALARIGEYLGKPVRFATQQEGLDYIAGISASFGPHSAQEWRALNQPLLREQGGGWVLHYDPRIALPFRAATPELGASGQELLWRAFEAIPGEVLVVRGAQSDLLTREAALEMVRRGQHASLVEIEGVGHAPTFVHGEQILIARKFFLGESDAGPHND